MKKITKRLRKVVSVLIVLILVASFNIPMAYAAEGDILNDESGIPDTVLYNYILSVSDTNNDGVIQKSEVKDIRYLWCGYNDDENRQRIKSLKGLSNLENLVVVDVTDNELVSLDGIQGLNLIDIRAGYNKIVDISAVEGMSSTLEYLDVHNNNLSKLPDMTKFTELAPPAMYVGTDFSYNKLTYNEMYYNLPPQLAIEEYVEGATWVDIQSEYQTPDPIPEAEEVTLNSNGIVVKGLIIPDAILQVTQIDLDIENAVMCYDVNLIRDYEKIQPDGTITITIPSEYSDCDVFWVKDDGSKVNMNAEYINGSYVFTTDHLSIYALVENPKPTEIVPVPTETTPEPTETVPAPTETTPEPTETVPAPTETTPESTETVPAPTETTPEPTETVPAPTETTPEPTETIPAPTETTPEPTETVPVSTEPTGTTPESSNNSSNGNGNNGSSSNTPNDSNNANTSNGAVATGDMFGIDNSILLALILAATTAIVIASKKRKNSSK